MSRPTRLLLRFAAIVAFGVAGLSLLAVAVVPEIGKLPDAASYEKLSKLALPELPEPSEIVDPFGRPMGQLQGSENREVVTLDAISPELRDTVLAVEDADFYEHSGVSLRGVLRAARVNSDAGEVAQGGSTITQQLVKLTLVGDERTIARKLKEASLALQLEGQLCEKVPKKQCKDRILEQYLNAVYLGRGAYGVQAASKLYFNKPASEVNYAEAAVLTALIRNPNGYDPIKFPEVAEERRRVVLRRMQEQDLVTEEQADFIDALPLPTETFGAPQAASTATLSYLERKVRDELLEAEWLAPTEELRRYLIFNGGLRIVTTLDPRAQALAEAAAAENPLKSANPDSAVALVAVDNSNGAIRAIVGEATSPSGQPVEIAGAPGPGRSSGSSFKPFTLVAALESGYSVMSSISGAPAPEEMKKQWGVKTRGQYPLDCPSKGMVNFITITAQSNNCAFMRLQAAIGFDKVKSTAEKLGITETLDPNGDKAACFTIGCAALVRPVDMAGAYSTIANDGRRNTPHLVERVEDRTGKVLFQYAPANEQVISPDVARQATMAMQRVVTGGTYRGGSLPQGRPAAGKTGTTEVAGGANTDVWFVGYTPQVTTAVWIGRPSDSVHNLRGGSAQGGRTAAVVWRDFMYPYLDGTPVLQFQQPDSIPRAKTVPDPWKSKSSRRSSSYDDEEYDSGDGD